MGGNCLEPEAADMLRKLQAQLNHYLDNLAMQLAKNLESSIKDSVKKVGDSLLTLRETGKCSQSLQQNNFALEADEVLRPLMDLLDSRLSFYAESCEKTVLKRLLKELWKIVINILEKEIVLPQITDKNVRFIWKISLQL